MSVKTYIISVDAENGVVECLNGYRASVTKREATVLRPGTKVRTPRPEEPRQ